MTGFGPSSSATCCWAGSTNGWPPSAGNWGSPMCRGNAVSDGSGASRQGDSTGQGGCRSSFLEPPTRSFLRGRDQTSETACGSCRSRGRTERVHRSLENYRTVFHSYHRRFLLLLVTGKVLPMFPVYSVTYVPGCTVSWAIADA